MTVPEGRRIFITGGAGFIGSNLAGRLVQSNQVTLFDNLSRDSLRDAEFKDHPNLHLVRGDVLDLDALRQAMAGHDFVIHCAAVAGIDTVMRSPIRTMEVNLFGTSNVLKAATDIGGLERVVLFSTSEVFGQHAFNAREADSTTTGAVGEARWVYGISKLAGEHLASAYWKEQGLPTVSLRPFNVFGPGQTGEGAIQVFVQRAIANRTLEIDGSGSQIRAWCFIDDMVDGCLLAMTAPNAVGETFNIGNARSVLTIHALALTVVRVLSSRSDIVFVPKLSVDVELRVPSVEKAFDMLGFEAKVDLEDGLCRTAEYYRRLESR